MKVAASWRQVTFIQANGHEEIIWVLIRRIEEGEGEGEKEGGEGVSCVPCFPNAFVDNSVHPLKQGSHHFGGVCMLLCLYLRKQAEILLEQMVHFLIPPPPHVACCARTRAHTSTHTIMHPLGGVFSG